MKGEGLSAIFVRSTGIEIKTFFNINYLQISVHLC